MTIVNISYNLPHPQFSNPEEWLKKIAHSTGILESMNANRSHRVTALYNLLFHGVINKNGVEYHFHSFSHWQLLIPVKLNNYVKRFNPDVVIIHGSRSPWQVLLLRWQIGSTVKLIVQNHAEKPFRDFRKYFQRWVDSYIDAYIFTSARQSDEWIKSRLISSPEKVKEIMEASSDFKVIDRKEAEAVTHVKGEKKYLWVGDLDANKNPLLVVDSFSQFALHHPGLHLYMIYPTTELLNELQERVTRHAAKEFIHLIGKVDHEQLLYWYNSSDFIISSSYYEGSGIAVCEAMSCGCIPILTDIPSFQMMTDQGSVGILFAAGDSNSLLAALEKSLSLPLLAEREKVLKQFTQKLSFDAIAAKIMGVIQAGA
jgi:glycosyltransferase involved in cell wall biosynthesis